MWVPLPVLSVTLLITHIRTHVWFLSHSSSVFTLGHQRHVGLSPPSEHSRLGSISLAYLLPCHKKAEPTAFPWGSHNMFIASPRPKVYRQLFDGVNWMCETWLVPLKATLVFTQYPKAFLLIESLLISESFSQADYASSLIFSFSSQVLPSLLEIRCHLCLLGIFESLTRLSVRPQKQTFFTLESQQFLMMMSTKSHLCMLEAIVIWLSFLKKKKKSLGCWAFCPGRVKGAFFTVGIIPSPLRYQALWGSWLNILSCTTFQECSI